MGSGDPDDATLEELRSFAKRSDASLAEQRRFNRVARARCERTRTAIRAHTASAVDEENLTFVGEELDATYDAIREQEAELERARTAMARVAGWWRELFEGAPEPYVITDHAGVILEANRVLATMLQFSGHLLRRPLIHFVHRADTRLVRDAIARLADGQRVDGLIVRLRPRGGAPIFRALVSATSHPSFDGAAAGHVRWLLQRTKPVLVSRERPAGDGRAEDKEAADGKGAQK